VSVRVFCSPDQTPEPGATIELDGEESHYLLRVRRRRVGDPLHLMNGHGKSWDAICVESPSTKCARVTVGLPLLPSKDPLELVLVLAMIESSALGRALTSAAELGVREIQLVRCARSQDQTLPRKRIDRIMRSSMRQSGRPRPPQIHAPLPIAEALGRYPHHSGFIAWEALASPSAPGLTCDNHRRLLVIGPEGGFVTDEIELTHQQGLRPVGLGPWTLRSEIAVVAGLALVRSL